MFGFSVALESVVSLLAIVQYFTFNGKLYWFRVLPQGVVPFGPFVNHNHFAGFVELISPPGLAMLFSGAVRRDKLPLLILLTCPSHRSARPFGLTGWDPSFLFEFVLLTFLVRNEGSGSRQLLMAAVSPSWRDSLPFGSDWAGPCSDLSIRPLETSLTTDAYQYIGTPRGSFATIRGPAPGLELWRLSFPDMRVITTASSLTMPTMTIWNC